MAMRLQALKFPFRRAPKAAQPTFFFHIPKCAGTSVWQTLFDIYGALNVFIVNSKGQRQKLAEMPSETRLAYGAIGGHGPLRAFRDALGDLTPYRKIVTLRDPIERAISEYNYVRAQSSHPRNPEVAHQSLATFVAEGLAPNRQIQLLTGTNDDVDGAVAIVTRFFDDWSLSTDVGELIGRLYAATGVAPRSVEYKNRGTSGFSRADLDAETLRLLKERSRYDLAFIELLKRRRSQYP